MQQSDADHAALHLVPQFSDESNEEELLDSLFNLLTILLNLLAILLAINSYFTYRSPSNL